MDFEPSQLLLWTLPDKRSHWFADLEKAASQATTWRDKKDVYVGVGLGAPVGPNRRIKSDAIAAIPALYADLDIRGPGHKQPKLFESDKEASQFLQGLPLKPTMVVHSGGGLQGWWCFEEPWIFESDGERREAQEISRGWNCFLKDEGVKIGRHVDAVGDLARVLRVPGTFNHKEGQKRPVKIVADGGLRFNPSDFEMWRRPLDSTTTVTVGKLSLREDANPPFEKFMALMEVEPRFRASWERKRRGLKDASRSGFDLSLANFAAQAGWTAQEITDLLLANHRHHGDPPKRDSYYQRTVQKAVEASKQDEDLEEDLEGLREGKKGIRDRLLKTVQTVTGVPLQRIIRRGDKFSLVLKNGKDVLLGDIKALASFASWSLVALGHDGQVIDDWPKRRQWQGVLRVIQRLVEVETPTDITEEELFKGWVREYAGNAVAFEGRRDAEHLRAGLPFREAGRLYLKLTHLERDIRLTQKRSVTASEVLRLLKMVGFTAEKIQVRAGAQNVSARYWYIDVEAIEE